MQLTNNETGMWRFHRGLIRASMGYRTFVSPKTAAIRDAWAWMEDLAFLGTITSDHVEKIASSPLLEHLTTLWLSGPIKKQVASVLANSQCLVNITRLHLEGLAIGDEGASAIAASPYLGMLKELYLDENDITAAGAEALLKSPFLNLSRLYLRNNRISGTEQAGLANRFGDRWCTLLD